MRFLLGLLVGFLLGLVVWVAVTVGVQALRQPEPAGPSRAPGQPDVVVSVEEAYLSRLANEQIDRLELPIEVRDLRVDAREGRLLVVDGRAAQSALGVTVQVPFRATVRPFVQDRQLRVQVLDVTIAGIPAPDSLLSAIEGGVNARLAEEFRGVPVEVVGVDTTDTTLVVGVAARGD